MGSQTAARYRPEELNRQILPERQELPKQKLPLLPKYGQTALQGS